MLDGDMLGEDFQQNFAADGNEHAVVEQHRPVVGDEEVGVTLEDGIGYQIGCLTATCLARTSNKTLPPTGTSTPLSSSTGRSSATKRSASLSRMALAIAPASAIGSPFNRTSMRPSGVFGIVSVS